jgi:hypothetical protein
MHFVHGAVGLTDADRELRSHIDDGEEAGPRPPFAVALGAPRRSLVARSCTGGQDARRNQERGSLSARPAHPPEGRVLGGRKDDLAALSVAESETRRHTMNGDASKECERGWRPPERSKQGGEALLRGNQSRSARRLLSTARSRGADSVHGIDRDLARSRDASEGDGGNLFGVFLAARLDQANREADLTPKESSGNLPGAAKRFREVRGGLGATIAPLGERPIGTRRRVPRPPRGIDPSVAQ